MTMTIRTKPLLGGAALAAFLIAPSLTDMGQAHETMLAAAQAPAHAPAPPAPPAPMAATPAPTAPSTNGNWVTWPTKSYSVNAVKFEDVVGSVVVVVKDSGPMTLDVSGTKDRVDGLQVSSDGGKLTIEGSSSNDVWDWRNWFNFSVRDRSSPKNLWIKVSVPRGADVDVEDLVGDASIADTQGHLRFEAAVTNAKIGHVGKAEISLAGSGRIEVAQVDGPLHLDIAGSGRINVGPVNGLIKADIAGAGDSNIGAINGGASIDIAGSGDFTAASIKGPLKIDIAGSGSVKIADGEADPLHVDIMGSGNLDFGGMAVDPKISALGSGSVKLKAYRGNLSSDGMATVKVGDKVVSSRHHHHDDDDDDDN
jgi:hypothetical protein